MNCVFAGFLYGETHPNPDKVGEPNGHSWMDGGMVRVVDQIASRVSQPWSQHLLTSGRLVYPDPLHYAHTVLKEG